MEKFTTVVLCADRKVYDLGKGEFPPQFPRNDKVRIMTDPKFIVVNAYTCTVEDAVKLKAKRKKKK